MVSNKELYDIFLIVMVCLSLIINMIMHLTKKAWMSQLLIININVKDNKKGIKNFC